MGVWLTPMITALWEIEAGESWFWAQSGQFNDLAKPFLKAQYNAIQHNSVQPEIQLSVKVLYSVLYLKERWGKDIQDLMIQMNQLFFVFKM